jgi:hypothetical protein
MGLQEWKSSLHSWTWRIWPLKILNLKSKIVPLPPRQQPKPTWKPFSKIKYI